MYWLSVDYLVAARAASVSIPFQLLSIFICLWFLFMPFSTDYSSSHVYILSIEFIFFQVWLISSVNRKSMIVLTVASESSQRCSCGFTALMYVEFWCEEQFNRMAIGRPDFSREEWWALFFMSPLFKIYVFDLALSFYHLLIYSFHCFQLPPHVGLLIAAFTRINEPDSIYGITLANEVIFGLFFC